MRKVFDPDKIAGCLVGLATGDALGAPLEFLPRSIVRQRFPSGLKEMISSENWGKGEYTDDTEMALLLAESLLNNNELIATDIARRFRNWARTAKDVGIQTRAVVGMPGYEGDPMRCARDYFIDHLESSAGNGAVMRCAPVALFRLSSPERLESDSRSAAQVTHWDSRAQTSCVIVNRWIHLSIRDGVRDAREIVLDHLPENEQKYWERLENIEQLPEESIKSSGYTVHTVEAAIWSFLTTSSFENALIRAVNLGDDADTVGAVTGAIAGAYYGYENIPKQWRNDLLGESGIRQTALSLSACEAH